MRKYELLNEQRLVKETKKKVAVYCRVSSDREDQVNSFASQRLYFREYIERHPDWELYEIFADEGISGTNTKKRKGFNHMIHLAKKGEFNMIITKEISRFARNTLDSIFYTRDLKAHGVGVIFMNDNINTLDPDAELRLTIMSSIAQEESRKTSERVKWGQKRRMEQGVVFGRDMLGYDVRDGKLFVNEAGAKIVRLIYDLFINERKGSQTIAHQLGKGGYKTINGSTKWSPVIVTRVLRNEKYCGDLVQKKTFTPDYLSHEKKCNNGEEEFVIIKDHHEPIISRQLFELANQILDSRAKYGNRAKYSNRYCFSGKIKCGSCHDIYVPRHVTRRDGSKYMAWRCVEGSRRGAPHIDAAGKQAGCSNGSIRNEDALHIMYLVTKALEIQNKTVIRNIVSAVCSVISQHADSKLVQQEQLKTYVLTAMNDIIDCEFYIEEFYNNILEQMVIIDREHIDVYLKLLSHKWSYAVGQGKKNAN